MSIPRSLTHGGLTTEQRHIFELAFNQTLRKLNLVDRNDPLCEIVAGKIIDIWNSGVTNAVAIAEIAFRELNLGE